MRFASPLAFLLLLAIPAVVWFALRRRRTGAIRFSSLDRLQLMRATWRLRLRHVLWILRIATLVLLSVALARPQTTTAETRISTEGIAIEMVVDRSGSMQTEMDSDGKRLSRLDVVKKVFGEFVLGNKKELAGRPNDLIGMIAFARFADTICPLVRAHDALVEFARSTRIVELRNEDGTAIGDAIALAAARLERAEEDLRRRTEQTGEPDYKIKSKIVILLTDGRNNAGKMEPRAAAELARGWGIRVYTIGIGGGESFTTVQTALGTMRVPSSEEMDESTLRGIADASGGKFFAASDAESLRKIYQEIDQLEKSKIEAVDFSQYDEAFSPYVLAAGALLLLEVLLGATWLRRAP